jgi:hypothetical protein
MPRYGSYGLTVETPFPCRWLTPAPPSGEPDVTVVEGAVPEHLDAPVASGPGFDAAPGRFLLRGGQRAGRFLVEDGHRVTVDCPPGGDADIVAAFLLSQLLPAVLRHRGVPSLHADAVVTPDGRAMAVSGPSGAGKSTTTLALLTAGAAHLADDAVALRLDPDGRVVALPGPSRFHVYDEAARRLGVDTGRFERYPLRPGKAVVVPESVASAPARLGGLFILSTHEDDAVRVRRVGGSEAFALIQDCILGPLLPDEHLAAFPTLAALADQVPILRVERPVARWTTDEIRRLILDQPAP